MATIIATKHIFGAIEPLPPKGFPEGRIRWRLRNNDFAYAFVKTPNGIRRFTVKEEDGYWVPGYEQGMNLTSSTAH